LTVDRSRAHGEWVYRLSVAGLMPDQVALAGQPLAHALGLVFGLGASGAFDEIARHDRLDCEIWLTRGQVAAFRMLLNFYRSNLGSRGGSARPTTPADHAREAELAKMLIRVGRGAVRRETPSGRERLRLPRASSA
jgi:hypothetical protein